MVFLSFLFCLFEPFCFEKELLQNNFDFDILHSPERSASDSKFQMR